MTPEQLEQLEVHLERVVKQTVNGKIDALATSFNTHQEAMQPVLDAYTTANKAGTFIVWLSKLLTSIGIILGMIIAAIKYLK